MSPETLRILQAADDPVGVEFPLKATWGDRRRIDALVPRIEAILGRKLQVDDSAQDASFHSDVTLCEPGGGTLIETIFALRFSNFGNLVSAWTSYPEWRIPAVALHAVNEAAREAGFVPVDAGDLQAAYTGTNSAFKGSTWWIRFFDYV